MLSHKYKTLCIVIWGLGIILSGCNFPLTSNATESPETIYTQVAKTVQVQLTQAGQVVGGNRTVVGISTQSIGTPIPPTQQLPTVPSTGIPNTQAAPTADITTADKAVWVAQSPADGSDIPIGARFKVTWTVENTGTTIWKTNYQLRFYAGTNFNSPVSVPFPKTVKPKEQVDLSLDLTAPTKPGDYQGIWVLTNDQGINFYPVYLRVKVVPPPTITLTPTIDQTATAQYCNDNPGVCITLTPK